MFMRLENIYWRPPALLLEWGCQVMRRSPEPSRIEHAWQMAALSVVGHAQDFEFLIGSPWEARANPRDEVLHFDHAIARFPDDARLLLARGIAAELHLFPNARNAGLKDTQTMLFALRDNAEVGAESLMRLGVIDFRNGRLSLATQNLSAAIARSQDPFVTYLSHLFLGHIRVRQNDTVAAAMEYRQALAAIPRAQSATFALAALLGAQGARREAASLVDLSITAPLAVDPWRIYGDGEDRFWTERIERLRQEIRR